jgi:hypothetical protein
LIDITIADPTPLMTYLAETAQDKTTEGHCRFNVWFGCEAGLSGCPDVARPGCCERGGTVPLCTGSPDVSSSARASASSISKTRYCTAGSIFFCRNRDDILEAALRPHSWEPTRLGGGDFALCATIP